ncbi:MAG TPA: DUF881 domain-containing protein [Firmicutes bacterium]|nr:DUF881 domain-containing protein [Bacillota bacterium]
MQIQIRSWQVGVGLASMFLGMLLVFQLRTETKIKQNLPTKNVNSLAALINKLETDRTRLEDEVDRLRQYLHEYDKDDEVRSLRMASGLYPLKGEGIEVILTDASRELRAFEDPNLFIIHYDHLELLINELWAAGAEAISINGERIATRTGLSCAGTTILVDTKRIAPPYIIKAIGDQKTLKAALTMPGGYVQTRILPYELGIFIEEKAELYIPAFKGSLVFEHATVVSEEELEAALSAEKKGIDGQREVFPYGDLSDFQNFHEDGGESR